MHFHLYLGFSTEVKLSCVCVCVLTDAFWVKLKLAAERKVC
jgi:hypothetical protein